jgi:hypothetical protein
MLSRHRSTWPSSRASSTWIKVHHLTFPEQIS